MTSPEYYFRHKRVLVTGGASGIGKGIVEELLKREAIVLVIDKDEDNLELLRQEFPKLETRTVDLRDWIRAQEAVKSLLPIHSVVNNAGYARTGPLNEITEQDFDEHFDTNIKAYVSVTQVVVDYLIKNCIPGSIVNISSVATLSPPPESSLYTASKAAVDGFTKALAQELGSNNIRVNTVNPGLVRTNLSRGIWESHELLNTHVNRTPLHRFVTPRDVAETVLFLLSDRSEMITGVCLTVDGGFAVSF